MDTRSFFIRLLDQVTERCSCVHRIYSLSSSKKPFFLQQNKVSTRTRERERERASERESERERERERERAVSGIFPNEISHVAKCHKSFDDWNARGSCAATATNPNPGREYYPNKPSLSRCVCVFVCVYLVCIYITPPIE